jgi:hypothetical protein
VFINARRDNRDNHYRDRIYQESLCHPQRVQNHGERFAITRRGTRVAALGPAPTPPITWGEFALRYRDIPPADDQFADDLEEIIASRPRIKPLPRRD